MFRPDVVVRNGRGPVERKDCRHIYEMFRKAAEGMAMDVFDTFEETEQADRIAGEVERANALHGEGTPEGFSDYEIGVIQAIAVCNMAEMDPIDRSFAGGWLGEELL